MKILTVFLAILSFTLGQAGASIVTGYTPEGLAHQAAVIFEGTPIKVTTYHLIGDRWITEARFSVERQIKGPLTAGDTITIRNIEDAGRTDQMKLAEAVKRKRKVLVTASIAKNTFPEIDGHYLFLGHFWNRPFIYADEPAKYLYTEKGAAIKDYTDVLKRVESQVARETQFLKVYFQGQVKQNEVSVEFGTEAAKDLYAGSAVLLIVPQYKEK